MDLLRASQIQKVQDFLVGIGGTAGDAGPAPGPAKVPAGTGPLPPGGLQGP
jgi:hypothetical protein